MANIYLGPSGTETLLPTITGLGNSAPDTPVSMEKQIQESTAMDGSRHFGFIATKRRWPYSWGFLTYSQLQTLQGLYALNQVLRLQDNFESSTWYNVVILTFTFVELRGISSSANKYFSAAMTLVEV
jgi:hypothetical protein